MKYTGLIILALILFGACNKGPVALEKKADMLYLQRETKPFTGTSTELYANGQKAYEGKIVEGKKTETWIWWYANGKKKWEENYKDGKLDGKRTGWDENGNQIFEHTYNGGIRQN